MNQTSNYYNQHAQAFFENTYQVEMESLYAPFLRYLPEQALILDLGCGSGRDTLAFKKKGYQVEAIDYSAELVKKARELTGIEVRQQSFYELNEVAKYDGIWACASLLHCERDRLTEVLARTPANDARRYLPVVSAAQKLISPAEMGELFKVMALGRGLEGSLPGLQQGDRRHRL